MSELQTPTGKQTVRILLVEDQRIFRDGLRRILHEIPGCSVVAEAADGVEAIRLAAEIRPDLVFMDLTLRDGNGIDATRAILANRPEARVIGLSLHDEIGFVIAFLAAGARGFVSKDAPTEEIARSVETVLRGDRFLSAQVKDLVLEDYLSLKSATPDDAFSALSGREREVLTQLARGVRRKGIAESLGLDLKTIDTHIARIKKKLGLPSTPDLARYAFEQRLIS